jgi:hypothetical protein
MGDDRYEKLFKQNVYEVFVEGIKSLTILKRYFRRYYKGLYEQEGDLERKLIEISPNIERRFVKDFLETYKGYLNLLEVEEGKNYIEYNSEFEKEELEFRICNYLTAASNIFMNAKMYAQSTYMAEVLDQRPIYDEIEDIGKNLKQGFAKLKEEQEDSIHANFVPVRQEDAEPKKNHGDN